MRSLIYFFLTKANLGLIARQRIGFCAIIIAKEGGVETKDKKKTTLYELIFKRFFDVFFSLFFIILLSPIMLLTWIVLKINLKGRAVFSQYRPGKNGKIFKFYKFRSMTNATDENGNLLPDSQRITKVGRFIRKTSLDELPQLFNILKGDMSFIGPRPRLVKDMIFYDEHIIQGYSVRPGLTGPSQVIGGRSTASWEDIFAADIKYANKVTIFKDIAIIFKTIKCLLKPDSASGGATTSKRDYYYADYLLRVGKISQEQYALGLARSNQLIATQGVVRFQPDLHSGTSLQTEVRNDGSIQPPLEEEEALDNALKGEQKNDKN